MSDYYKVGNFELTKQEYVLFVKLIAETDYIPRFNDDGTLTLLDIYDDVEIGNKEELINFARENLKEMRNAEKNNAHHIHLVGHDTANRIIENRSPRGLFYEVVVQGDHLVWVGIDNCDGNAWTEDFKSYEDMESWLLGKAELEDIRDKEGIGALEELFDYIGGFMTNILPTDIYNRLSDKTVYYFNGNDSTAFDWDVNGHLCEFGIRNDEGLYVLKTFVKNDGTFQSYIFRGDDYCMVPASLPKDIDLKAAVNTLIKAEENFEISETTKDWDLPLENTLDKVREKISPAVGVPLIQKR